MEQLEFAEYAKKHIKEYLPEEYQDKTVRLNINRKINETYMAMTIDRGDQIPTPAISISQMYEQYEAGEPLDKIMRTMAEIAQMEMPQNLNVDMVRDYEQAKPHLFVRLSDQEMNAELMQDGPYESIDGLLVTYHVALEDENGLMSVRVTNDLMNSYGITAEQLKLDAITNMQQTHPARIASLNSMVGIPDVEPDQPLVMFASVESGTLGAGVLLYPGMKEEMAQQFGCDFFILPSSIHEVLLVPDDGSFDRGTLESMVRGANAGVVEDADRLSDHVYHYDAKDRVLEKAETFEKRMADRSQNRSSVLGKLKEKKEQAGRQMPAQPQKQNREAMAL